MDTRSDRGQFYPGGATSSTVPAGGSTDKVDRVALGEIGESYTLKTVKNKVDEIVRVLAPAAVGCLVLSAWCLVLGAGAATAPLEDIPNTAPVVTNEEDAVAMAAVGDLRLEIEDLRFGTNALDSAWRSGTNRLQATILERQSEATNALVGRIMSASNNLQSSIFNLQSQLPNYALKSELPTDYLRENDITNFATRSWIYAQGYATGAEITARLDAQDNAIGTATNAQNTAVSTASNALAQAHAADMAALRIGTNRLDQAWRTGTNVLAQAHRTDIAALKSGTNTLAVTLRQATNALAIAHRADVLSLRTATTTASNALAQAHRTDIAALKSGTNTLATTLRQATNALAQAHRTDIAALKSGTNTLATTLRQATNALVRADARLEAKIDALELTGGMTRLWSSDATTYQDATGVVWQVHKDWLYTMSGTNYTAEQMGSNFDGGYLSWEEDFEYEGPYGTNEVFTGWFVNDGSGTSPLGYWNEDWSGATNATLTSAQYQFAMQQVVARRAFTNAVNRVAYTNDVAATAAAVTGESIERLEEMGTVYGATRLMGGGDVEDVTASDVRQIAQAATNYTDAATNALAASIGPADMISDGTNAIDAAGNVYMTNLGRWVFQEGFVCKQPEYRGNGEWKCVTLYVPGEGAMYAYMTATGSEDAEELYFTHEDPNFACVATKVNDRTGVIGKLALTNDIPDVRDYATYRAATNAAEAVTAPLVEEMADMRTENALVYRLYQGSNVVAEVTNYNSNVHAPELRIMQLNESNEYITVWAETNGLSRTLASARQYTDEKIGELGDVYAPKAWSKVTAGMGVEAPSNTTWLSTARTVIAGGLEYEKHVTSNGAIWLLQSNGMTADFHPQTNNVAFLDLSNADGTPIFRVEKTDSFLVGVHIDDVTVDGDALVCHVPVVASEHPLVRVRATLIEGDWAKEEDGIPASLATVTWSGSVGDWTCRIQNNTGGESFFAQMEYLQEGGTKIVNSAPLDVSNGIICKDGIHKVRPVYTNGAITWEVVP